jgi:hypothetical protein
MATFPQRTLSFPDPADISRGWRSNHHSNGSSSRRELMVNLRLRIGCSNTDSVVAQLK